MDIKLYLEEAIAKIEAETEREVNAIRQQVAVSVSPKNQELEQLKAEEINKLTLDYQDARNLIVEQHNNQLVALQEKYETDKNNVCKAVEDKKKQIFESEFTIATGHITSKSSREIAKLKAQIEDLKE